MVSAHRRQAGGERTPESPPNLRHRSLVEPTQGGLPQALPMVGCNCAAVGKNHWQPPRFFPAQTTIPRLQLRKLGLLDDVPRIAVDEHSIGPIMEDLHRKRLKIRLAIERYN